MLRIDWYFAVSIDRWCYVLCFPDPARIQSILSSLVSVISACSLSILVVRPRENTISYSSQDFDTLYRMRRKQRWRASGQSRSGEISGRRPGQDRGSNSTNSPSHTPQPLSRAPQSHLENSEQRQLKNGECAREVDTCRQLNKKRSTRTESCLCYTIPRFR